MVIVEVRGFTARICDLLSDEAYRLLQLQLLRDPEAGRVIPGTGGLRKLRWTGSGRGKRGGVRVIYFWHPKGDGVPMKEELFAELLESVRQGGAILRGEMKPSRVFRVKEPDVRAVREGYGLSQSKFAALMGISAATLRNWEQGRRKPEGSARVLLRVVARHPEAVLDAVTGARKKAMQRPAGRAVRR